ncbi:DinB family protein [Streptomyces sp. NPDC057682]|uniref:DinB family protein n=1 Tax=Streptomyces sp. NPDC057682 TaxID=3346210 RepID=UPI003691C727
MSPSSRRAELFLPGGTGSAANGGPDARFTGSGTCDERRMLRDFLGDQRRTLELKCSGLDGRLALRSVEPSTLSLLGLLRHLADVERRWFRRVLAGEDAPPRHTTEQDPDGDFDVRDAGPGAVAEAWRDWRAEVAFADRFAEKAPDLDVRGHDSWRGTVSLRWVLIHMIEEYARHNGHADLLRERIDGARGL